MRISRRLAAVLLSPLSLLLIVGGLIPAAILFVYSFYDYSLFLITPAFHFAWYRTIFSDPVYRTVAWNTIAIALPTVLISVAGGYAIAYYLAFKAKRSRTPAVRTRRRLDARELPRADLCLADAHGERRNRQLDPAVARHRASPGVVADLLAHARDPRGGESLSADRRPDPVREPQRAAARARRGGPRPRRRASPSRFGA